MGAKNWKSIERIANDIPLDWVMIANSLTVHSHPADLLTFVERLHGQGTVIINSAVFNGGFLVGRNYYNYVLADESTPEGKALYEWRDRFFAICEAFNIEPAEACFNYSFNIPGISSVALSTTNPDKVKSNIEMATRNIPSTFWDAMREQGLM